MRFMLFVLPTVPRTLGEASRFVRSGRNDERYPQMKSSPRRSRIGWRRDPFLPARAVVGLNREQRKLAAILAPDIVG